MTLIPYKEFNITSEKSPAEVKESLKAIVSKPDWNINFQKAVNNRILEGKISDHKFVIINGRYGLTLGFTSLLPVMKGKVRNNGTASGSYISIVIRPLRWGLIILAFFYLLCFMGIYFSIQKSLMQVLIVCCIFICITYISVITKFNKEMKVYIDLMKRF